LKKRKILLSIFILGLFLFSHNFSFAEIRIFFSPGGDIAEEIIRQIDNAQEYIDIAIYSFTYEPLAGAIIRAKRRGVKIRILMDKGQSKGKCSKYKFFLDNDIAVIQDRRSGYMHNKIAIIDGRILFTGSYNWSKSAEERNEENLLEFIDEEEIIKVYQGRLDYLWEFNKLQEHELSEEKRD
jgi:phosphatidylserine/phosphatidylglycerophosphate/cardiolipin synthase-like enzyme